MIVSLAYKIKDDKIDKTNFNNIYHIKLNTKLNKFVVLNKKENISFNLTQFIDLYKDFQISEANFSHSNTKDFNNKEKMMKIAMNKLINNYMYFLLDNSKNIKGFIMIEPYKSENYTAIGELYTNPKYRNQGVATSLLNYAKYIGIRNKTKFLTIGVEKDNKIAYNLYTRFGFEKYKDWRSYSQEKERDESTTKSWKERNKKIANYLDERIKKEFPDYDWYGEVEVNYPFPAYAAFLPSILIRDDMKTYAKFEYIQAEKKYDKEIKDIRDIPNFKQRVEKIVSDTNRYARNLYSYEIMKSRKEGRYPRNGIYESIENFLNNLQI